MRFCCKRLSGLPIARDIRWPRFDLERDHVSGADAFVIHVFNLAINSHIGVNGFTPNVPKLIDRCGKCQNACASKVLRGDTRLSHGGVSRTPVAECEEMKRASFDVQLLDCRAGNSRFAANSVSK